MNFSLKKKHLFFLVLFLLILLIRLWPLRMYFWWDETVYLQHADILLGGTNNYNEFSFRPPLLSILFSALFFIYNHPLLAQLLIILFSLLSILFIYLITKEIYGEQEALLAGFLLAFTPFFVEYAHYLLTDLPALTLLCIAFYFLILGHKRNKNFHYFLSGLFFSLAILMKFTSLFSFFIIPLYFFLKKVPWKNILYLTGGILLGLLPFFIWAQITQGFFIAPFLFAPEQVTEPTPLLFYLGTFLSIYPVIYLLGILLWVIYYFLEKEPFFRNLLRLDLLFLCWIIFFLLLLSALPHKETRYILPLALPLTILSARGIILWYKHKSRTFRTILLSLVFLLFIFSFAPSFDRFNEHFIDNEKPTEIEVTEYILQHYPSETVLYSHYNYPVYAYYTKMNISRIPDNPFQDKGILILYEQQDQLFSKDVKEDNRFAFIRSFQNVSLYTFTPERNI